MEFYCREITFGEFGNKSELCQGRTGEFAVKLTHISGGNCFGGS